MPQPPPADSDLPSRLAAVEQREAWYRAKTLREFLELKKAVKLREVEVNERREDLEARDTVIHQLHAEVETLRAQLHTRALFLEQFSHRLAATERQRDDHTAQVARMRRTWGWSLSAPLRSLQKRFAPLRPIALSNPPPADPAPGRDFVYHLPSTPFRIYPPTAITLHGWAFSADRRPITAIRSRVDTTTSPGEYGLPEPEVAAHHGWPPAEDTLGFTLDVLVPPGRHTLGLEAELGTDGWFTILSIPVWGQLED